MCSLKIVEKQLTKCVQCPVEVGVETLERGEVVEAAAVAVVAMKEEEDVNLVIVVDEACPAVDPENEEVEEIEAEVTGDREVEEAAEKPVLPTEEKPLALPLLVRVVPARALPLRGIENAVLLLLQRTKKVMRGETELLLEADPITAMLTVIDLLLEAAPINHSR